MEQRLVRHEQEDRLKRYEGELCQKLIEQSQCTPQEAKIFFGAALRYVTSHDTNMSSLGGQATKKTLYHRALKYQNISNLLKSFLHMHEAELFSQALQITEGDEAQARYLLERVDSSINSMLTTISESDIKQEDADHWIIDQLTRQGNVLRFEKFWNTNVDFLFARAVLIVKDVEEANDVLHDAYMRVIRYLKTSHYPRLPEDGKLAAYTKRIMHNIFIDGQKRRAGLVSFDFFQDEEKTVGYPVVISEQTAEGPAIEKEMNSDMESLLQSLSPMDQELARLALIEDCSTREIAHRWGMSVETVRSRYKRLRVKLLVVMPPTMLRDFLDTHPSVDRKLQAAIRNYSFVEQNGGEQAEKGSVREIREILFFHIDGMSVGEIAKFFSSSEDDIPARQVKIEKILKKHLPRLFSLFYMGKGMDENAISRSHL